jgi:DNA repair protein RadC
MTDQPDSLEHLSDHEVVQILLGSRKPGCKEVKEAYQAEAIGALAGYDLTDLQHALQLTPAGTKRLGAALELHRRMLRSRRPTTALRDPEAVAQVMLPLAGRDHECLWCLCLDPRCQLIGEPIQVSQGDIDGTDAGPRVFFRNALRRCSVSAIAVHNHPSGNVAPSAADVAVTRRLIAAGKALDISLADHVIVNAAGGHHSMRRSHPGLWS